MGSGELAHRAHHFVSLRSPRPSSFHALFPSIPSSSTEPISQPRLCFFPQALRAFRTDLATERETAELSAQVYDKQAQLEAALARPAPAAVLVGSNDTPVAAAAVGGGDGKSWWKLW